MIKLNAADLNYLLQQVNIGFDYTQLTSPIDPNGVREVSGRNNNLVGGFEVQADGTLMWTGSYNAVTGQQEGPNGNADWGQADTDFLRLFQTDHPTDGTSYGVTYDTVVQMGVPDAGGNPVVNPAWDGTTPGVDGPTQPYLNPDWTPTFAPDILNSTVLTGSNGSDLLMMSPLGMMGVTADGSTSPRTITQLIASSDVDPQSPTFNQAAYDVMIKMGGEPVDVGNTVVGSAQTGFMPNPGVLGGVTYNEFFVAFGQFFDHGLDFISKGGGYVLIPLSPNDPLFNPDLVGSPNPMANMMMLNRASLSNPDGDFILDSLGNRVLSPDATPQFNNNTGLMIDQSQTYGSHEAHNALVRQYDADGSLTGRLIEGSEDGIIYRVDTDGNNIEIDLVAQTAHIVDAFGNAGAAVALTFSGASVEWPVGSGTLVDGRDELASWSDMRANAARIGVELIDTDVLDIPAIRANAVGGLLFTPQQAFLFRSDQSIADINDALNTLNSTTGVDYYTVDNMAAFDPFFRDDAGNVLKTNQPVLADMGVGANPADPHIPFNPFALSLHKVSGDGRVNENIGLTAVHHVFHEEHNIQAAQVKDQSLLLALQEDNAAQLLASNNGWLSDNTVDLAGIRAATNFDTVDFTDAAATAAYIASAAFQDAIAALNWDGEKVYQAARIITESEYNHIAIDQYMTGLYPALPEFVSYSADINLSVSLEFSQAVFRLGHSQLTETIKIATADAAGRLPGEAGYIPGNTTEIDLFDAFLNPTAYDQYSAAGIISGLLNQQGNEMDEFVTSALQQSLVGVPLDLAALNIARGRDVGLPTLNELRQQAFDGLMQNGSNNSNGSGIAPYHSWADFAGSMRNPESLANFIAAYALDDGSTGTDWGINEAREAYEAGTGSLQAIRDAANTMLAAYAAGDADATAFMQGGGAPTFDPGNPNAINGWVYNEGAGDLGFWEIDLWIGGLAEQPLFDGPLGTTFSLILLDFAQRLQDGDRFYYLYRMPVGHHLGDQIIGEQFSDLVMRSTGLENIGDAFGTMTAAYYLDSGENGVDDGQKTDVDADNSIHDYFNAIYETLPDTTRNIVVANKSFEIDSLADDGTGPVIEAGAAGADGNRLVGAPAGWDLRNAAGTLVAGGGGTWDTRPVLIPDAGHEGEQVGYIGANRALTQDVDQPLVAGNSYTFSANIGNRANTTNEFRVQFRIVDTATGLAIVQSAEFTETDVPNGEWSNLVWNTGPIGAGDEGKNFRIEIVNLGTNELIFIDNVNLSVTEPGGSANDGHILVVGGTGNDFIKGALGDDYLYGGADDDVLEGAQGNDHLYGDDGDDWITDYENDDFIYGGAGNDYIAAGPGVLDTSHGGDGNDEVHGGDGIDEVFGDDGDDILYGEGDTDLMEGGDGNDFIDGGDSVDEIFAGNGNDWMRGGVGDDHMNGGSGNDLMEGGGGPVANDGDRYFGDQGAAALPLIEFNGDGTIGNMDIALYENLGTGVTASLQTTNATGTNSNLLDQYILVDGIVGSSVGDILEGGDLDAVATNGWNNQLIGGGGSDVMTGLGDDAGAVTNPDVDTDPNHYVDWIFGDAVVTRNDLWADLEATQYYKENRLAIEAATADGSNYMVTLPDSGDILTFIPDWGGRNISGVDEFGNNVGIAASKSTTGEMRVQFADGSLGHILGEDGVSAGDVDTAVYRGNQADYLVTANADGTYTIVDQRDPTTTLDPVTGINTYDGTDMLLDIELVEFADTGPIAIADAANYVPPPPPGPNLAPFATGVAAITPDLGFPAEPREITFDELLAATSDPEMDVLTILNVDIAVGAGGIALTTGDGGPGSTWTYTPEAGDTNDVVFAVEVTDGTNEPVIVTASLVLADEPAPPAGGTAPGVALASMGPAIVPADPAEDNIFTNTAANEHFVGGAQADELAWTLGDGVDFFNGANGTDIFTVIGNGDIEHFNVYAPDAAGYGDLRGADWPAQSLVVTRTVGTATTVVAGVLNVEELIFNLGAGDSFAAHGTFTGLIAQDTITINSDGGHVVVDISKMTSNEHVVLNTTGTYEVINNASNAVTVNCDPVEEPVNQAPSVHLENLLTELPEGCSFPLKVADIVISDDGIGENKLKLTGADAHLFQVVAVGVAFELQMLAAAGAFGWDGEKTFDVNVEVDDEVIGEGSEGSAAYSITIEGKGDNEGRSHEGHHNGHHGHRHDHDGGRHDWHSAERDSMAHDCDDDEDEDGVSLNGSSRDDTLKGTSGDDRMSGGSGDDQLNGGSGDDKISGGSGDDRMNGGSGDDNMSGGSGDDRLAGGSGDDRLDGGSGDDELLGGSGDDTLLGGSGDDILDGGTGDDILNGGSGNDLFVFKTDFGNDTITSFKSGQDMIDLSAFASMDDGMSFNDLLFDYNGSSVDITVTENDTIHIQTTGGTPLSEDDFAFS